MDDDLHDEIAALAYELYEKNGRVEDNGLANWLEAEKIVRARYAAKENDKAVKSANREYMGDERRMYERVIVKGSRGNISNALNARIVNISLGGAAIETTKKLHVNMEYGLRMNHGRNALITRGRIVWSVLADIEKKESGDIVAVYRAGMKFQQPLLGIGIF
jgi:hypothetical protein